MTRTANSACRNGSLRATISNRILLDHQPHPQQEPAQPGHGLLSADWKVNGWLRIRARGNVDYIDDKVRQRFYASTAPALAGNNGRYIESGYSETLFNGEVLALFDRRFTPDWTFSATVGAS